MGQKKTIPASIGADSKASQVVFTGSGAMTGTNTITSAKPTFIGNVDNGGLEISWIGTPTGTLSIQCSISNVTYYSLTFSPGITQPAGSAGGYLIDLNQIPFPYIQISYTNVSGSGTLSAWTFYKDLN